ncbi:MAG: chorismate mutase [Thermoproteota archaeon]
MEKISSWRRKIDKVDRQILNFIKRRAEICESIGEIKREQGCDIRDLNREEERYEYVAQRAAELELDPQKTKKIYQEIIALCIDVQKRVISQEV